MSDSDSDRARLVRDLAEVAAGDRFAMQRVYDATAAKMFGIVLGVTADRDGAEEVLQDVYVRAWHGAGRFDAGIASPITWLATLARRAAIDWVRAERRQGRIRAAAADEPVSDGLDTGLVDREEQARVMDCFGLLDTNQANCIRAAFFEGYTYPELARAQAVPLPTVKSWVRRGLLRLRECLDDVR